MYVYYIHGLCCDNNSIVTQFYTRQSLMDNSNGRHSQIFEHSPQASFEEEYVKNHSQKSLNEFKFINHNAWWGYFWSIIEY